MALELYPGEVELKRVKEADIGWITKSEVGDRGNGPEIIELPVRDHPLEEGQRWVLDTSTGTHSKSQDPSKDEWVLVGPKKK